MEKRLHRPAPGPAPRGRQERGPAQPAAGRGPADPGRAVAGGGGTGGDERAYLALAGEPHRPEPAVLPARRGGDFRRQGASAGRAARQRGHLQPRQLPGRDSPAALCPRPRARTVAGSDRRPGRGRGAVLAQARGGSGDAGDRRRAGGGADTGAVAEVFVNNAKRLYKN